MVFTIPNIKKGTVVFTIDNCKIEEWFVEDVYIKETQNILERDFSFAITLKAHLILRLRNSNLVSKSFCSRRAVRL